MCDTVNINGLSGDSEVSSSGDDDDGAAVLVAAGVEARVGGATGDRGWCGVVLSEGDDSMTSVESR